MPFGNLETAHAVEGVLILPLLIMGLSHILRPAMWRQFFACLHAMGEKGVIVRAFMLELVPATSLFTLHQVWTGAGIIITLYGIALMIKVTVALLVPRIGLRSVAMAETHGDAGFIKAGTVLVALSALSAFLYFY